MKIQYEKWWSTTLNREMELKVYGDEGKPFIVFPCSKGRFFDYENFGMVRVVEPYIEQKQVMLITVDSVDSETWYNWPIPPGERNNRYNLYDKYIVNEVVPFVHTLQGNTKSRIMTTGNSMGAFHAVNFFLKHPDLFEGTIALSGLYRLDHLEFNMDFHDIPYVYYNSPVHYLANLSDAWYLEWYRKSKIIVCVGQGSWEDAALEDTRSLDYLFRQKNIPAWIDYWGYDVNHNWNWWFVQIQYFLNYLYSQMG